MCGGVIVRRLAIEDARKQTNKNKNQMQKFRFPRKLTQQYFGGRFCNEIS